MGNQIRDKVNQNRPNRGDWFDGDFWDKHGRPPYYGDHGKGYWWRGATAAGVASWLRWDGTPYYYGYTDGSYWGPYDEYGSYVDYDGTPSYATQAEQIEDASEQLTATTDEWMPLGVFALSKEGGTAVTPNMYLQLALSPSGQVSGTLYNATTNQTIPIEGMADKASQRVAWKSADNPYAPILETGIYNLTQDEVPVQVSFQNGKNQEIVLVRVAEK